MAQKIMYSILTRSVHVPQAIAMFCICLLILACSNKQESQVVLPCVESERQLAGFPGIPWGTNFSHARGIVDTLSDLRFPPDSTSLRYTFGWEFAPRLLYATTFAGLEADIVLTFTTSDSLFYNASVYFTESTRTWLDAYYVWRRTCDDLESAYGEPDHINWAGHARMSDLLGEQRVREEYFSNRGEGDKTLTWHFGCAVDSLGRLESTATIVCELVDFDWCVSVYFESTELSLREDEDRSELRELWGDTCETER